MESNHYTYDSIQINSGLQMTDLDQTKGHSEEFFGEHRNYWYNMDFLELMAKRWDLKNASSLLDVGCGQCHWSSLLSHFLKPGSRVVAVDKDIKWSAGNTQTHKYFEDKGLNFELQHGDVYDLPFPDHSFDVVTAQTLLIHLQSPKKALSEMKRIVKPDGIVICAEPNTITQSLLKDSSSAQSTIEDRLAAVRYALVYEQGKIKSGQGDDSIGDLLPGIMHEVGFQSIKTYMSDKCNTVIPPYDTDEMKTFVDWMITEKPFKNEIDDETRTFIQAHGEKYGDVLESSTGEESEEIEENRKLISSQSYHRAGAYIMYLVSGNK